MNCMPRNTELRTSAVSSNGLLYRTIAMVAASMMLIGGAKAGTASSASFDVATTRARALCSRIVGIQPGDRHFDDCVASLANSLESARREHVVVAARDDCFARGLLPGTSKLSLCLLHAESVVAPAETADNLETLKTGVDQIPARLDSSSTLPGREQQACARTGFDPAFGAFATCVSDLQNALQSTDVSTN